MSENNNFMDVMDGFEVDTGWDRDHYAKQVNDHVDKKLGENPGHKLTEAEFKSILGKLIELNDTEADKNTFSFFGEGEPKGKGKWIGDLFNTIIENADSIDTCLSIFSICETKSRHHEAPRNYVHEHYVSARNKIEFSSLKYGSKLSTSKVIKIFPLARYQRN